MNRENSLDSTAVSYSTNCECLVDSTVLSSIISVTELVRQLRSRKLSDNSFYKNESALVGSFFYIHD